MRALFGIAGTRRVFSAVSALAIIFLSLGTARAQSVSLDCGNVLNCGTAAVGSHNAHIITVTNNDPSQVVTIIPGPTTNSTYAFGYSFVSIDIPPGGSAQVPVDFHPQSAGTFSEGLAFTTTFWQPFPSGMQYDPSMGPCKLVFGAIWWQPKSGATAGTWLLGTGF
jgi:hypothetical protein